jgi:hypothetical protein
MYIYGRIIRYKAVPQRQAKTTALRYFAPGCVSDGLLLNRHLRKPKEATFYPVALEDNPLGPRSPQPIETCRANHPAFNILFLVLLTSISI